VLSKTLFGISVVARSSSGDAATLLRSKASERTRDRILVSVSSTLQKHNGYTKLKIHSSEPGNRLLKHLDISTRTFPLQAALTPPLEFHRFPVPIFHFQILSPSNCRVFCWWNHCFQTPSRATISSAYSTEIWGTPVCYVHRGNTWVMSTRLAGGAYEVIYAYVQGKNGSRRI
jgi:hypothetical protein